MVYVILGMHKSGTTLVSQILHKSGINMGTFDELVDYDSGNQYERKETQEINEKILKCGDEFSLNVVKPMETDKCSNLNELKAEADHLIKNLNKKYKDWGFKDPRTCLTYSFWKALLPEHKVIFVYRSPEEVCAHYQRGISPIHWCRKVKTWWKSIIAWYTYNSECLRYLRGSDACFITINYSDLMTSESAFKELELFTNSLLVDCRTRTLYRSHKKCSIIYSSVAWIQTVFFSRSVKRLHNSLEMLT